MVCTSYGYADVEEPVSCPYSDEVDQNRLHQMMHFFIHLPVHNWRHTDCKEWPLVEPADYPHNLCYWLEKLAFHNYLMVYGERTTEQLRNRLEAIREIDMLLAEHEQVSFPSRPTSVGKHLDRYAQVRVELYRMLEEQPMPELTHFNCMLREYVKHEVLALNTLRELRTLRRA